MGNQVFANRMEVSCKAADGKSICAFPDVCMTPPQSPATPPGVPIPYPNTGLASDTSDGSTTVKISGQEVMLKNKSYFKKSTGDEAGCAPMKGVVTHKITGKVYFTAWSMDVKVEGENVVRHLDMTTHNHASAPGNGAMQVETDEQTSPSVAIPPGCPDPSICDFADEPEAGPHSSLDSADNSLCNKARKEPETQQRGTMAEVRALRHNRKNAPKVKKGEDVECLWECRKCHRKFEIDQVVRDDSDKVIGIIEVKSGGPLRSTQGAIHSTLALQKGIRSIKKVQHQTALKKCKSSAIDHIDINAEPLVGL